MDMRVLYWLSCNDGKLGCGVSSESHIDFVFVRHPGGRERGKLCLSPLQLQGGSPRE